MRLSGYVQYVRGQLAGALGVVAPAEGRGVRGLVSPLRGLIALPVLLLPFFLGGARPWLWSMIAGLATLGAAGLLWTQEGASAVSDVPRKLWLALGGIALVALLQVLPLSQGLLGALSPERLVWLQRAAEAASLSHAASGTLSYSPLTTLFSALWWLFLLGFTYLLSRALSGRRYPGWLISLLFLVAALEAGYGLVQVLVPSVGVLWEAPGRGVASGTFVNRNHFAAFLGMIWPVLLGHLLAVQARGSEAGGEEGRSLREKQGFLGFVIGLVLLALFFSQSRGGIIGSLVALTVFVSFAGIRRGSVLAFIAICWIVMLAYGSLLGFDEILARFDALEIEGPDRLKIWQDTWRLIQDHPWAGVGLGCYRSLIAVYQSHLPDDMQISHAHNDYLELIAELGLPLALMIIGLAWGYWLRCALRLRPGRRDAASPRLFRASRALEGAQREAEPLDERWRFLGVGALAGGAAFLFHGLVEFNWQIPANQLYFLMLMTLMGRAGSKRKSGLS